MITFRRAKTAIIPYQPATQLVESGPYKFTRNPMYTGMTLAYLGGTALLYSLWPLLLLPVVLTALMRLVVDREEAYLGHAFGSAYDDYRSRVRRFL
jgi:protein-S-isoprenylcysteine O-methyltransferase Ste14